MPRRRQVSTRRRRASEPAPPPSQRIRNGKGSVQQPDGEVREAVIGGDRLAYYADPGSHPRVSTEGFVRQLATDAAELANSGSRYINALVREIVSLRAVVEELQAEIGHVPPDQDPTVPLEQEGEIIDASFDADDKADAEPPYDPKPVSLVGGTGPVDPATLPPPEPEPEVEAAPPEADATTE